MNNKVWSEENINKRVWLTINFTKNFNLHLKNGIDKWYTPLYACALLSRIFHLSDILLSFICAYCVTFKWNIYWLNLQAMNLMKFFESNLKKTTIYISRLFDDKIYENVYSKKLKWAVGIHWSCFPLHESGVVVIGWIVDGRPHIVVLKQIG